MRKIWIKMCKWMLAVLGISISIASCESPGVEYGQPTMDFSVKGKVMDSRTGDGVAGIEVTADHKRDTTSTDGSFALSGQSWPATALNVELRDIDSEKDGAYKNGIGSVPLLQVKKGDGNWYHGAYEATDVILTIEKEENE